MKKHRRDDAMEEWRPAHGAPGTTSFGL